MVHQLETVETTYCGVVDAIIVKDIILYFCRSVSIIYCYYGQFGRFYSQYSKNKNKYYNNISIRIFSQYRPLSTAIPKMYNCITLVHRIRTVCTVINHDGYMSVMINMCVFVLNIEKKY